MEPELGLGNPVRDRDPGAANSSLSESPAAKRVDTKHTPAGLHPAATNTPPLDNFEYIDAPCSRCHQRQQRRVRSHTHRCLSTDVWPCRKTRANRLTLAECFLSFVHPVARKLAHH